MFFLILCSFLHFIFHFCSNYHWSLFIFFFDAFLVHCIRISSFILHLSSFSSMLLFFAAFAQSFLHFIFHFCSNYHWSLSYPFFRHFPCSVHSNFSILHLSSFSSMLSLFSAFEFLILYTSPFILFLDAFLPRCIRRISHSLHFIFHFYSNYYSLHSFPR